MIRLLTHEHNPCDSAYHYTGVPSFVNKPYINACVLVHVAAAIYTVEEVAKHNSKTDCWIIVEGGVYDITEVRNNGERVRSNHRMCLFLFPTHLFLRSAAMRPATLLLPPRQSMRWRCTLVLQVGALPALPMLLSSPRPRGDVYLGIHPTSIIDQHTHTLHSRSFRCTSVDNVRLFGYSSGVTSHYALFSRVRTRSLAHSHAPRTTHVCTTHHAQRTRTCAHARVSAHLHNRMHAHTRMKLSPRSLTFFPILAFLVFRA